jgi:hypothetical protein
MLRRHRSLCPEARQIAAPFKLVNHLLTAALPAKTSRRSAKVLIFQWRSSLLGVQSPAEYRMPTAIDTDDRARFVKRLTIFPVTAAKVAT